MAAAAAGHLQVLDAGPDRVCVVALVHARPHPHLVLAGHLRPDPDNPRRNVVKLCRQLQCYLARISKFILPGEGQLNARRVSAVGRSQWSNTVL